MNKDQLEDVTCVVFFLLGARKEMFNSHTGQEALRAFCRLHRIDHAKLVLHEDGIVPIQKG